MKRFLFILLCFLPLSARPSDSTAVSPDIIHTQWYSHNENIYRRVDIYVPEAEQPLPVLYLIHGINGYEGSWQDMGGAIDTLKTLISEGRCAPMILVMPDCNKWPFKERPTHHGNLWKCVFHYGKLSREHEIEHAISDLIDMIDTTYSVSSCAIAGLSDGARMAANVANTRPDRIRQVGLFSPVLHKDQLPKDSTQIYAIYAGKNDMFFLSAERFHRRLNRAHYPHEFIVLNGSHNWRMWRQCLSLFLEQWADDQKNHSDNDNRCTSF